MALASRPFSPIAKCRGHLFPELSKFLSLSLVRLITEGMKPPVEDCISVVSGP
jgi:hypothetical protein